MIVSVCRVAGMSQETHVQTSPNLLLMLPLLPWLGPFLAAAAVRYVKYVFPVSRMTSYFSIIGSTKATKVGLYSK